MRALLFALTMATTAVAEPAASPPSSPPTPLTAAVVEVQLPAFQAAALAKDLPVQDVRFGEGRTLLLLGASALWQWHLPNRTLQRLAVRGPRDNVSHPLRRLGADGPSLFAAADDAFYQINWERSRLLRYGLPPAAAAGEVLGFAGAGDDYWLVHTAGLFKFDRYGKALLPRFHTPFLAPGDHVVFDPKGRRLWFARKTRLFRVDLGGDTGEPVAVLHTKHELLDLQLSGQELIAHTHHAVLRLALTGKLKRSIPVDGPRQLIAAEVAADHHAYLFSDHLLEVFAIKTRRVERYRLPLEDNTAPAAHLAVAGSDVAVVIGGHPHVFHLDRAR